MPHDTPFSTLEHDALPLNRNVAPIPEVVARSARAWAAVVPGTPPPVRLLSLNLDSTRIPGGQPTFGKSCIDQLFPAPDVGSMPLILSISHPSVASVLPSPMNQGTDCRTFTVDTKAVASDTTVTISAQLGAQLLTFPLRLTAAPGAKQVNSFFLDPLSVTGGASSQGTLVLDGIAPSSGFLVTFKRGTSSLGSTCRIKKIVEIEEILPPYRALSQVRRASPESSTLSCLLTGLYGCVKEP
jgi:hypothetical protein